MCLMPLFFYFFEPAFSSMLSEDVNGTSILRLLGLNEAIYAFSAYMEVINIIPETAFILLGVNIYALPFIGRN